jgi:ElaB/YqjD/DUF883 family membrane-anchored ribosome-binding protein
MERLAPRFSQYEEQEGRMDKSGQQEGLASQASAKVEDAASLAQDKASELREQGSARVRDQFDERSTKAGSQVRALAEALRRSGNELSNEDNSSASQLTTQAADRIERVGNYLERKSGDELMRDVERFVRRRPWMLAGLGMLVGAAAARFVKASSEQRYDENRESGWPKRSGATTPTGSRAYGQAEFPNASSYLRDEPATVGADVSGTQGDPADRDPYAGTK